MNIHNPKKIIIRMPNWLGDAVMGTPILKDLKAFLPDIKLTVLCHEAIRTLLLQNPYIDDFIVFSREKKHSAAIFSQIGAHSFDAGILLTRSFSSAWWFFRSDVKNRIGFRDHWRSLLLTHAMPIPKNEETEHQVITYKRLLEPLGISRSDNAPELFLDTIELDKARALLQEYGITNEHILIGINPGAAFGSAKCWPKEHFIALTQELVKNPLIRVIYFGDKTGKPLVDEICLACPFQTVNLAAKTDLRMLLALISLSHVCISNDSGPMHVAAALNKPLVAIFGSTNEVKTGPYGARTVIHKHVACSPCYLRTCPIDFRCMKTITVQDVLYATQNYLGK